MVETFNYDFIFDQALEKIKSIRDPRAKRPETVDLRWNDVQNQVIFNFVNHNLEKYYYVASRANVISISCLNAIIIQLMKKYGYTFEQVNNEYKAKLAKAYFTIVDKDSNTLLLFKGLEDSPIWKFPDREPNDVIDLMKNYKMERCAYIYLVFDNAYLQIIGHNNDQNDPGRGYNFYSIKWFFEKYFSSDEWSKFLKAVTNYINEVKDCIGYSVVKTLTPGILINFRKVTENEILSYKYEGLLNVHAKDEKHKKEYILDGSEFKKIEDQFLNKNSYLGLLGSNDYSESLITAEWLYDSMKKAKAIDLTIIGTGYFKAVEQLLYEIICMHRNEGKTIKKDYAKKELPTYIELNDTNIKQGSIDFSLGAMAVFFENNSDLYRKDLYWKTKEYVTQTIFEYKDLRNGYFHKNNIHDWNIIEVIRKSTIQILFLLFGTINLTNENKKALGFPDQEFSDYYKLCEYVNYHNGDIFFITLDDGREEIAFGHYDMHTKVHDNYIVYSGLYFKELGKGGRIVDFRESYLPGRIILGKFVPGYSGKITMDPVKVKVIFENGKFVGPSIAAEEKLDY